jgi:hypothetical protein
MEVLWATLTCFWKLDFVKINIDEYRKCPINFAERLLHLISVKYLKNYGICGRVRLKLRVDRIYYAKTYLQI